MSLRDARDDENGIMMVARRRGVLVIAAPPRRKVPPLVRGGGVDVSLCRMFGELDATGLPRGGSRFQLHEAIPRVAFLPVSPAAAKPPRAKRRGTSTC